MTHRDIHPCDAPAWHARLKDFLYACVASGPQEEADRIREAHALLAEGSASRLPGRSEIEAMIAAGACESAAIALLDRNAGFMLSRGGGGLWLASVVIAGTSQETTAEGPTLALALLSAQAAALLAGSPEDACSPALSGQRADARLN